MAQEPPIQRPNTNPTPRARFQSGTNNIRDHRALLESPAFERACDFALLEYQRALADQSRDGNSAMAVGFRAMGAIEFLGILKTLGEPAAVLLQRKDLDNLPDVSNLKRQ